MVDLMKYDTENLEDLMKYNVQRKLFTEAEDILIDMYTFLKHMYSDIREYGSYRVIASELFIYIHRIVYR